MSRLFSLYLLSVTTSLWIFLNPLHKNYDFEDRANRIISNGLNNAHASLKISSVVGVRNYDALKNLPEIMGNRSKFQKLA